MAGVKCWWRSVKCCGKIILWDECTG